MTAGPPSMVLGLVVRQALDAMPLTADEIAARLDLSRVELDGYLLRAFAMPFAVRIELAVQLTLSARDDEGRRTAQALRQLSLLEYEQRVSAMTTRWKRDRIRLGQRLADADHLAQVLAHPRGPRTLTADALDLRDFAVQPYPGDEN